MDNNENFLIFTPEMKEVNKNILINAVQNNFPNEDKEVIKKILDPFFDKDVLLNLKNPLEVHQLVEFGVSLMLNINPKPWRRLRFKTKSIHDYRPLVFNPKYPWWCSALGEDYAIIIAYLPKHEKLHKYWDDAYDVEVEYEDEIEFSERFPKPDYFQENKIVIEGVVNPNVLEGVDVAHVTDTERNLDLDDTLMLYENKKVRVTVEVLD